MNLEVIVPVIALIGVLVLVLPGFIQTNMTDKLDDGQKKAILERIPMKKLGNASDIAKAVGFLCSENADYITGQTLHVNGGLALI